MLLQNPTSIALYGDRMSSAPPPPQPPPRRQPYSHPSRDGGGGGGGGGAEDCRRRGGARGPQLAQLLRSHRRQFLGELFAREAERLADLLADVVVAGGVWQGVS